METALDSSPSGWEKHYDKLSLMPNTIGISTKFPTGNFTLAIHNWAALRLGFQEVLKENVNLFVLRHVKVYWLI